jgi:hypothetical protein
MTAHTIELPPLVRRAAVTSLNAAARTIDVVFSTGAAVDRVDFLSGKRYREVLSLAPGHVDLRRLNAGAPVLDAHRAASLLTTIGVVEHARVEGQKRAIATIRFSRRADVAPIWQDVQDGIVRNVSVGYRVHRVEESHSSGVTTRTAVLWEPYEISLVPIAADVAAQVRSRDAPPRSPLAVEFNSCQIVERARDARADDVARVRRLDRAMARDEALEPERDEDRFEPFEPGDDAIAAACSAPSTAPKLIACRAAMPLPAQESLVATAVALARDAGLQLPDDLRIVWKDGRPDICAGACECDRAGSVTVYLSVNAWPHDLRRTTFHELQHVDDVVTGRQLSRLEMERRAEAFAVRMMKETRCYG